MTDPDIEPQFSWPLALFVTGISFLAFFYFLERLNESGTRLFLWIGLTSLAVALLSVVVSVLLKKKHSSQTDHLDQ